MVLTGSKAWQPTWLAKGTIAAKSLINQPRGAKRARYIMPAITGSRNKYIHLKSRTILSRPTRNPDSVSSFAVVVHSMRTLKKWQKMALRRWKEIPPKKRRKNLRQKALAGVVGDSRDRDLRHPLDGLHERPEECLFAQSMA